MADISYKHQNNAGSNADYAGGNFEDRRLDKIDKVEFNRILADMLAKRSNPEQAVNTVEEPELAYQDSIFASDKEVSGTEDSKPELPDVHGLTPLKEKHKVEHNVTVEDKPIFNKPGVHGAVALRRGTPPALDEIASLDDIQTAGETAVDNGKPVGESWQKEALAEATDTQIDNKKPAEYNFVKFTAFDSNGQMHTTDGKREVTSVALGDDEGYLSAADKAFVEGVDESRVGVESSDDNAASTDKNVTRAQEAMAGASLDVEGTHNIFFDNNEKPADTEIKDLGPARDFVDNLKSLGNQTDEYNPLAASESSNQTKKVEFSEVSETIVPDGDGENWDFDRKPDKKSDEQISVLQVDNVVSNPDWKVVPTNGEDENILARDTGDLATDRLKEALAKAQDNQKPEDGVMFDKSEGLKDELRALREAGKPPVDSRIIFDNYVGEAQVGENLNSNNKSDVGSEQGVTSPNTLPKLKLLGEDDNDADDANGSLISPIDKVVESPKQPKPFTFVGEDIAESTVVGSKSIPEAVATSGREEVGSEGQGDNINIKGSTYDANDHQGEHTFFYHVDNNIIPPTNKDLSEQVEAAPNDNSMSVDDKVEADADLLAVSETGDNLKRVASNDEGVMHLPSPEELAAQAEAAESEIVESNNQEEVEVSEPAAPLEMVSESVHDVGEETAEPVVAEDQAISNGQPEELLAVQEPVRESDSAEIANIQVEAAPQNAESVQPSIETGENIQTIELARPTEQNQDQNTLEQADQINQDLVVEGAEQQIETESNADVVDNTASGDNVRGGFLARLLNHHPNAHSIHRITKKGNIDSSHLAELEQNNQEPLDKAA